MTTRHIFLIACALSVGGMTLLLTHAVFGHSSLLEPVFGAAAALVAYGHLHDIAFGDA